MKKIILAVGIIILLLIVIVILWNLKSEKKSLTSDLTPTPSIALPTISDKISVELIPLSGNQSVTLKIKGLDSDLESIEYDMNYITGNGLSRGVLGKIKLSGEKEITRENITLGTCSSGHCVYDTGVTSINLSLRFNSSSGPQIFQKSYNL